MARAGEKPRIRPAEAADERAFRALWSDFTQAGPEPCAPEAVDHVWRNVMDGGGLEMLVAADRADRCCGFALYVVHPYSWSTRPICYLLDLYVEPAARRQGFGAGLMETLGETGRRRGWLRVYWMTQKDNAEARAVYDRIATVSPLVRYDMLLGEAP